jgi:hypothetical protein
MTTEVVAEWARHLTQNMSYMLPGIREEIVASLNDSLVGSTHRTAETNKLMIPSGTGTFSAYYHDGFKNPTHCLEWHRVRAADIIEETVSRVVNRAFLGSSICTYKAVSFDFNPLTEYLQGSP